MTTQLSFTKYENRILPGYREKMNHLESVEDVRKFFHYTMMDLVGNIFTDKIEIAYDDIDLTPGKKPYYTLSGPLLAEPTFKEMLKISDLPRIMDHIALIAQQRYTHLEKRQPDKTEAKLREKASDIHMKKGTRGRRF